MIHQKPIEESHLGPDPSHGGLTTHRGPRDTCSGPDCGPSLNDLDSLEADLAREAATLQAHDVQVAVAALTKVADTWQTVLDQAHKPEENAYYWAGVAHVVDDLRRQAAALTGTPTEPVCCADETPLRQCADGKCDCPCGKTCTCGGCCGCCTAFCGGHANDCESVSPESSDKELRANFDAMLSAPYRF